MRLFIIFVLCFQSYFIVAQEGFVQAYDLDYPGMSFYNMLLVQDTLVVFGRVKHETDNQWGMLFAKLDTLGNVLDHKVHFDTLGDHWMFEARHGVIKTTDNGYACVGQLFFRHNPILVKLDVNGNLEYIRDYPDETVLNMEHLSIVGIENGFISTGLKQQKDDYKYDAFIMRTDKQGNKLWEISYGEYDLYDGLYGIYKEHENQILLTGGSSWTGSGVPTLYQAWWKPIAVRVDTLVNILWEWEGEQVSFSHGGYSFPLHLYEDNEGNWVHAGVYSKIFDEDSTIRNLQIIKRDTNFNIIQATSLSGRLSGWDLAHALAPTPDGGWVMAGESVEWLEAPYPTTNEEGWYVGGFLGKVNAQGDSLWSRTDTIFASSPEDARANLSAVVALPSGSIIASGTVNNYVDNPSQSYGWLIKVDKDGCLTPACHPLTDGVNLTPLLEGASIFPNPTKDKILVQYEDMFDVQVYDQLGQVALEQEQVFEETQLDLTPLPKGVYFVKIWQENRLLTKKLIKE